ncbi:MAG: hypothetical protein JWN08_3796 [Frankiales bacterium]|nr:hypothetical protein [Frankiales bacterium]
MPTVASHHNPSLTRDQLWMIATASLALLTVVLALLDLNDAGMVTGVLCVIAGGWSQMVSETTAERFETVTATLVGAVALAYCAANSSGVFT